MAPLEIDGTEPPIIGKTCQQIVVVEYLYAGELIEPANDIFLRFADQWFNLYFDWGIIFWREASAGPKSFVAEEINASYPVVDVATSRGLVGQVLTAIKKKPLERGTAVTFEFGNGRSITFADIDDITTYSP